VLSQDIAGDAVEDRPHAIELIGAFNRLLEAAGAAIEDAPSKSALSSSPSAPGAARSRSAS
jgi:hypothetical protein